jgi:hypothetical protein
VSGIARQKKPAELHGLNHRAAHSGDAFFEDGSFGRPPAVTRGLPRAKFFPDPGIRPLGDVFIRRALQIEPGDLGRAHAEKREAPFVIRVDQFIGRRRRLCQDAEPCERIRALKDCERFFRDRRAGDPVRAVASRQEIAFELLHIAAVVAKTDRGRRSVQSVQAHVAHFKANLTSGVEPRLYQILDYFLLGIHRDGASGREVLEIDAMPTATETQLDPVMYQPLLLQPRAHAAFHQQIHGALLQHAGSNALFHVLASVCFENHRLDPFKMQKVREHQPRGTSADYPDLGAHAFSISSLAI